MFIQNDWIMDRRKFILNTALTTVAVSAWPLVGCDYDSSAHDTTKTPVDPDPTQFELNEVTIAELQGQMQRGERTARQIAEMYLARIEAIDKKGPALNSIIELNPDALSIADALDRERKAGSTRGPLHGIPILIKDNIDTGDRMMTTAGSVALEGHHAAQDAFVVKKLRDAGAVILGKTNLSEWANFRSTHSCSGWSSRGGQTKNPIALARSPQGSSSGSGAAVAANLCAVAVGTETDGSVIGPATVCGIVGMKPSVGAISRTGIIPISASQDTAGPMTRTVRDAAILLSAMTGVDASDAATTGSAGKVPTDYTSFLDPNALAGKRIGVEKTHFKGHEGVVEVFKNALEVLKKAGATLVEIEMLKEIDPLGKVEFELMQYEFKDGLNRYLATANAGVKSLAEVIAFNKANETRTMPYFKQDIFEMSEARGPLTDPHYLEIRKQSYTARAIIDGFLQSKKLDAIVGITSGLVQLIDLENGDCYPTNGFYFGQGAAAAGYPSLTVPMGRVHELPIGLSFIGGMWQDGPILGLGYAYEQATKWRRAPSFLK
jgi:amidase